MSVCVFSIKDRVGGEWGRSLPFPEPIPTANIGDGDRVMTHEGIGFGSLDGSYDWTCYGVFLVCEATSFARTAIEA